MFGIFKWVSNICLWLNSRLKERIPHSLKEIENENGHLSSNMISRFQIDSRNLLRGIGFAQWMMKFARTNITMLQQDDKSSRHGTLYDWKSPRSKDHISRCHIRCLLNAWSIWWNSNVQKQEEEISEFSCFFRIRFWNVRVTSVWLFRLRKRSRWSSKCTTKWQWDVVCCKE